MSEHAVQTPESNASSVEAGPIEATATPSMAAGVRSERCGCGGHLIRRTRKDDGQPFLGCTRFPTCRRTKTVAG
jgi:ssDNA-binding Zn-finger/Zn-ribbon topoisomerase 1